MCFSAEADVVLGLTVGAIGIDALRHVTRPAQWPLASLPLLFAAHQLNEAVVWWGLEGPLDASVVRAAAGVYLLIAFALPVVVPVAVAVLEPQRSRRRLIWALALLGAVVSTVLIAALVRNGPAASAEDLHIAYDVSVSNGAEWTALYILATCGGFLASSDRRIAVIGVLNLAAVAVLAQLLTSGVISLWCAWAAVVSVLIAVHLRRADVHADDAGAVREAL